MSQACLPKIVLHYESLDGVLLIVQELAKKSTLTLIRSCEELLVLLEETRYDLLVYTLSAPADSFLAVIKKIRSLQTDLLIVLLQGEPSQAAVIEAFRLGIADFFPDPVKAGLVCERIDALLQQARRRCGLTDS